MSAHNIKTENYFAPEQVDPGASGTILVDKSPYVVGLASTGAESRTLAAPLRAGIRALLYMKTDGGDITLTITNGINEDGDTTFTFSDPGQFLELIAVYESAADLYRWRKTSDYATANITPTEAASLNGLTASVAELNLTDGLTATTAELNQIADADQRVVTLTAAGLVLTAADSGKIYFINNATGFIAATLPLASTAAGVTFTFINKTANTSGNHTIVTSTSENVLKGNQNDVGGAAGDNGTADDTISFVANQSVAGDKVELFSDGTSWFAYAISRVAAGMTFTQAS